jgi:hypothetical protein
VVLDPGCPGASYQTRPPPYRGRVEEDAMMRVIHFERTSGTGHAVPWCGVWGSTDTDWTEDADGVTCVACRGAMIDRARGLPLEDASTRGSSIVQGDPTS